MANSKRKCAYCKEPAAVNRAETLINGFQFFCCKEHFIEYAVANRKRLADKQRAKEEKESRKEAAARKEAQRTRSWYVKKAQQVFNRFIRLRDKNKPCISCGRPLRQFDGLRGQLYDAGHYRSVGSSPELRFNENNCHGQCVYCNRDRSGNVVDYRISLIKRIGQDSVDELERFHESKKYSIDDLKQIIEEYRRKCKELE